MIGDAQKAFSGNQWTHINALNIDVKNWENVKLEVVA